MFLIYVTLGFFLIMGLFIGALILIFNFITVIENKRNQK
jgi:hypothetical protein